MSTLLMLFPVVQHTQQIHSHTIFHLSTYLKRKNTNWELHTLKRTFCSRRKFSRGSIEEKLISLDTALQFKILLGTLASCSTSGWDLKQKCTKNDIVYNLKPLSRTHKSSEFCHSSLPVSTSRRLIQFLQ